MSFPTVFDAALDWARRETGLWGDSETMAEEDADRLFDRLNEHPALYCPALEDRLDLHELSYGFYTSRYSYPADVLAWLRWHDGPPLCPRCRRESARHGWRKLWPDLYQYLCPLHGDFSAITGTVMEYRQVHPTFWIALAALLASPTPLSGMGRWVSQSAVETLLGIPKANAYAMLCAFRCVCDVSRSVADPIDVLVRLMELPPGSRVPLRRPSAQASVRPLMLVSLAA